MIAITCGKSCCDRGRLSQYCQDRVFPRSRGTITLSSGPQKTSQVLPRYNHGIAKTNNYWCAHKCCFGRGGCSRYCWPCNILSQVLPWSLETITVSPRPLEHRCRIVGDHQCLLSKRVFLNCAGFLRARKNLHDSQSIRLLFIDKIQLSSIEKL